MTETRTDVRHNRDLIDEIKSLAPWHLGIQLNDEINTGTVISKEPITFRSENKNQGVSLLQLRDVFLRHVDAIYPDGLSGKRFLDCACNAGGYSFWTAERDVEYAFGFDVRDHWINQARFVQQHRTIAPVDNIEFAVSDLMELGAFKHEPFDFTIFKGIFYHLADPVSGLKIAADLTKEVLILNTAMTNNEKDGFLKCSNEDTSRLMSGAHGLNWFPTGPLVLKRILNWLGFVDVKQTVLVKQTDAPGLGRIELYASRIKGQLDNLRGEYI